MSTGYTNYTVRRAGMNSVTGESGPVNTSLYIKKTGRAARGGKACPSGQSSPYVPATVPPTRAPPTAWAALARSTNSIPNRMPVSMPGTEELGATTAASLFGVFKEAVSDDDSGFIDL